MENVCYRCGDIIMIEEGKFLCMGCNDLESNCSCVRIDGR